MIHYPLQPETALRDSLALAKATDERSYSAIVADIEARHAREGISEQSKRDWEAAKVKAAERIAGVIRG